MSPSSLENCLAIISSHPVLDSSIPIKSYIPLDLSVDNCDLHNINVSSSSELETYIRNLLKSSGAKVAVGGYLERRAIYSRSDYFAKSSEEMAQRNVHLGIDLWIEAGSEVYAPLEGQVHSFKNNINYGDYGPTLILKHQMMDYEFYTLYGHLSMESLNNKQVGATIDKGQQIATLGTTEVNGDYPPHLHFQIIEDIGDNNGDYPGVSSQKHLEFYKTNCPDPNLLLKLI